MITRHPDRFLVIPGLPAHRSLVRRWDPESSSFSSLILQRFHPMIPIMDTDEPRSKFSCLGLISCLLGIASLAARLYVGRYLEYYPSTCTRVLTAVYTYCPYMGLLLGLIALILRKQKHDRFVIFGIITNGIAVLWNVVERILWTY